MKNVSVLKSTIYVVAVAHL